METSDSQPPPGTPIHRGAHDRQGLAAQHDASLLKPFPFRCDILLGALPADYAPWRPLGGDPLFATDNLDGTLSDPVMSALIRHKYLLIERG